MMQILRCPVCQAQLIEETTSFRCSLNHVFDKSRSGYVNLLLPTRKHSKEPGDNKEMVKSRADFLSRGHYAPIADLLSHAIKEHLMTLETIHIADIGCGNGYYLQHIKNSLLENKSLHYIGLDISKEAVNTAAKKIKAIQWLVSTCAELPFMTGSIQSLISVFSPLNFTEFNRVLDDNGCLVIIAPSSQHLYELRSILFTDIKLIDDERILQASQEMFNVAEKIPLHYKMNLTTRDEVANLFGMTPYYWRSTPEKKLAVLALSELTLTVDVVCWVFKKKLS
ncbi:MAG: putative RNA methyltransferase [Gammaproteobacteria bacterium]